MAMDVQLNVGVTGAVMKSGVGFTPSKNLPYRSAACRQREKCFSALWIVQHQIDLSRMARGESNRSKGQFLGRVGHRRVISSRCVLPHYVVMAKQLTSILARLEFGVVAMLGHGPVG